MEVNPRCFFTLAMVYGGDNTYAVRKKWFLESRHLIGSPIGDYYTLMPVTGQEFGSFCDEWSGSEYNHTGPWSIVEMISWWKGAEWVFLRVEYYDCIACKGSYCRVLFSEPNIIDAN